MKRTGKIEIGLAILSVAVIILASPTRSAADPVNDPSRITRLFRTTTAQPLPVLNIDRNRVSVSGISSGGFMAHQFHVAHGDHLAGAGIIAGGPYECAMTASGEPSVWKGMYECTAFVRASCPDLGGSAAEGRLVCEMLSISPASMIMIPEAYRSAPDFFAGPGNAGQNAEETAAASLRMADESASRALARARQGKIDPIDATSRLFSSKVYIFHGGLDSLLPRGVSDATVRTYRDLYRAALGAAAGDAQFDRNVRVGNAIPAAHAIVTNDYLKGAVTEIHGRTVPAIQDCDTFNLGGSFINDCAKPAAPGACPPGAVGCHAACATAPCDQACATQPPCDETAGLCTACTAEGCVTACAQAIDAGESSNAGTVFEHIYGGMKPPSKTTGQPNDAAPANPAWRKWLADRLFVFDQAAYLDDRFKFGDYGVSQYAYLFVPPACNPRSGKYAGRACPLHVAFHGCLQGGPNTDVAGGLVTPAFPLYSGYLEWADANDIIVLFPQARPKLSPLAWGDFQHANPQGCWDLWGYTNADYATRDGKQIALVARMINGLAGDKCFLKVADADCGQ